MRTEQVGELARQGEWLDSAGFRRVPTQEGPSDTGITAKLLQQGVVTRLRRFLVSRNEALSLRARKRGFNLRQVNTAGLLQRINGRRRENRAACSLGTI